MKKILSIVGLLVTVTTFAADWQSELSPSSPGKFPPPRRAHTTYLFGWSAVSAADGSFNFTNPHPGQLRLDVAARTTGIARTLFRLDASHQATVRMATLQPISMGQTEAYKDETIRTRLNFDSQGLTRIRKSNVPGPGNGKPKRFEFSPVFDIHSAFLWVRSQKLTNGDSYKMVVYPSADPFLTEVSVTGREKIKAAGTTYKAIKLELKLRRINKDLQVESYQKFKRATAWVSDDGDRLLLKIDAELFIGSVWAELQKAEFQ